MARDILLQHLIAVRGARDDDLVVRLWHTRILRTVRLSSGKTGAAVIVVKRSEETHRLFCVSVNEFVAPGS